MLLNINKMNLFHAFAKLELPFMLFEKYRRFVGDVDDLPMFEDFVFDVTNADAIYQSIIDRVLADPEELKIVPESVYASDHPTVVEMLEAAHIIYTQFPQEMLFCAAVCAVSLGMADTSIERLIELAKPQLLDEEQSDRLRAVVAAVHDIEVLEIYNDHLRNIGHIVPASTSTLDYQEYVEGSIFGFSSL